MVSMMMGEQNPRERLPMLLQPGEHRYRITRIDDPATLVTRNYPDVIVIEARKGDGILHERVTAGLGVSIIVIIRADGLP